MDSSGFSDPCARACAHPASGAQSCAACAGRTVLCRLLRAAQLALRMLRNSSAPSPSPASLEPTGGTRGRLGRTGVGAQTACVVAHGAY